MKLWSWLKRLTSRGMNGDVRQAEFLVGKNRWWDAIECLRRNPNLTIRFRFTNGKLFTLPEFVFGDNEKIIGRVNGIEKDFWRRGIMSIEIVPKVRASFPRSLGEGLITTWKVDKYPKFGFVFDQDIGASYYFNEFTIKDQRVSQDLGEGRIRQKVRFRVVRSSSDGKPSKVEILDMLESGQSRTFIANRKSSSDYARGWAAKNSGRVDEAIGFFKKVMEDRNDVNYLSSIKEVAECINRKDDPQAAYEFLESHRSEFPNDEQISIDRMEFLYFVKGGRYTDALNTVEKILSVQGLPINQKAHFEHEQERLLKIVRRGENESVGRNGEEERREGDNRMMAVENIRAQLANGLSSHTLKNVSKFLSSLAIEVELGQEVPLVITEICQSSRKFIATVNYEDRLAAVNSISSRIAACKDLNSDEVMDEYVMPILIALRDSAKVELSGLEPQFVLSHKDSASYAVDDAGFVRLKFSLKSTNDASPAVEDITSYIVGKNEGNISAAEDEEFSAVKVGECLRGGESCDFEIMFRPDDKGRRELRDYIELQFDYVVKGIMGDAHGTWNSGVIQVALEKVQFPQLPNRYKDYAGGKLPRGNYFVGRNEILGEMKKEFLASNGGGCFLIYGQRRTGKSTLRDRLFDELDPKRFLCSQTSMRGKTANPQTAFYEGLCLDVGKKIGVDGAELKKEVDAMFDDISTRIMYIGEKVAKKGFVWVVAIDEFTDLFKQEETRSKIPDFTGMLRSLIDDKVFHLFIAGMDSLIQLQEEFSNDSEVMRDCHLTYLNENDIEALLRLPMEEMIGPKCFAEGTTVFRELMEWSGGVPQLAQNICGELVDLLNDVDRRRICDGDINNVCCTMLERQKVGSKNFSTFLEMGLPDFPDAPGPRNPWMPVYKEIADNSEGGGTCRREVLSDRCALKLDLLIERRAVEDIHGGLRLKSRLFAEWLRRKHGVKKWDEEGGLK